ncbi:MAG TPA: hypothetical protein VGB15_01010, partial [Longimicrobium sp.]
RFLLQLHRCTDGGRENLAIRFQLLDYAHEPQYVVALVNKVYNIVTPRLNGYAASSLASPIACPA